MKGQSAEQGCYIIMQRLKSISSAVRNLAELAEKGDSVADFEEEWINVAIAKIQKRRHKAISAGVVMDAMIQVVNGKGCRPVVAEMFMGGKMVIFILNHCCYFYFSISRGSS
ncbi:hypothetical protein GOP47_0009985 [Adiantum capillus-veneris]|uniref:Uncharacterized protein n=1 Tax=Adiantum capillus-veneris TaxID=13818 RepID=A0A9D4ZHR5_ADICA|nr:hypothetical protein GOP47_0009985 [Adiantum capillus-veneris]